MARIATIVLTVVGVFLSVMLFMATTTPASGLKTLAPDVLVDVPGGHGSGTLINVSGMVITARHVVEDEDESKIRVFLEDGEVRKATILWKSDKQYDIAMLRINPHGMATRDLSCGPPPPIGTIVEAIGNPKFLKNVHTFGKIAADPIDTRDDGGMWSSLVLVDQAIIPGMSGGALVLGGKIIGIVVATLNNGLGGAVPSSVACSLMGRA